MGGHGVGLFRLICIAYNGVGSGQYSINLNIGATPSAAPTVVTQSPIVCSGSINVLYTVNQNLAISNFVWSYSGSGATIVSPIDTAAEVSFGPTATSGSISVYAQNTCGSGPVTTIPVSVNSPVNAIPAGTAGGPAVCDNHDVSTAALYKDPNNCSAIATIVPAGASPVSGIIQSCVTVDASVNSYHTLPYVQRHFNLVPANSAATATGTVTLYFTQSDFDRYNTARGTALALPTGPTDAVGAANLQVTVFGGTGTTPGTYPSIEEVVTPGASNVIWNAASGRWEVSFLSTGFGGYFISGTSLRLPAPTFTSPLYSTLICRGGPGYFYIGTANADYFYWQLSGDQGSTWSTVADNADFQGSATESLTVIGNDTLENRLLRLIISNTTGADTSTIATIGIDTGSSTNLAFVNPDTLVCQGQTQLYAVTGFQHLDSLRFFPNLSIPYTNGGYFDSTVLVNFNGSPGEYELFAQDANGCGFASKILTIHVFASGTDSANAANQQECSTTPVYPGVTTMYTNGNCDAIGSILPSGSNPVSGAVTSCVTVTSTVASYNGIPYVPRYYSLEPSANASTSTATLTLYFTQGDFDAYNAARGSEPALPMNSTDATGISNLRVSQFHGTGTTPDTYVGGSGTIVPTSVVWNSTTSLWAVTFDITGFSGFFVSGASIIPLPLTLTNFSGQTVAAGNQLSWQTASEENTAYFEVQRAGAGSSTFEDIGRVAAAGNSSLTRQYSYTDALTAMHPAYSYRLKMVDLDGRYTYSPIVTLEPLVPSLTVLVSPNPFVQPVSVTVGSPAAGTAIVSVLNLSGARVAERSVVLQKGDNALDVSLIAGLPQGIYFLQVTTATQQQTVKFVKE